MQCLTVLHTFLLWMCLLPTPVFSTEMCAGLLSPFITSNAVFFYAFTGKVPAVNVLISRQPKPTFMRAGKAPYHCRGRTRSFQLLSPDNWSKFWNSYKLSQIIPIAAVGRESLPSTSNKHFSSISKVPNYLFWPWILFNSVFLVQSYCDDPDLVLELKNLIVIFADTLQVQICAFSKDYAAQICQLACLWLGSRVCRVTVSQ